jgi:hypothetical protein
VQQQVIAGRRAALLGVAALMLGPWLGEAGEVEVCFEERTLAARGGAIEDRFALLAVHVCRFTPG